MKTKYILQKRADAINDSPRMGRRDAVPGSVDEHM